MCACVCVCVGFRRPILTEKLFIIHKFVDGFLTFLLCSILAVYLHLPYNPIQSNLPKVSSASSSLSFALVLFYSSLFLNAHFLYARRSFGLKNIIWLLWFQPQIVCVAQKLALLGCYFSLQHNHNDKTWMFTNLSMLMNKQKRRNELRIEWTDAVHNCWKSGEMMR